MDDFHTCLFENCIDIWKDQNNGKKAEMTHLKIYLFQFQIRVVTQQVFQNSLRLRSDLDLRVPKRMYLMVRHSVPRKMT